MSGNLDSCVIIFLFSTGKCTLQCTRQTTGSCSVMEILDFII